MSPKRRRLTAKEVERVLRRHGFEMVAAKGGHCKWRNGITGNQVIVPRHGGNPPLPIGTLVAIMEGSGIRESEWE